MWGEGMRFGGASKRHRRSSLRHRPPDHRPAPQPAWKTWRADDAESSQGTCDTHGPQAVSSSRLEAARIGRSFGEGQPLMGQERQPLLPKGRRSYFTLVLRAQSLQGSSEAPPRCSTELPLDWNRLSVRIVFQYSRECRNQRTKQLRELCHYINQCYRQRR